MQEDRAGRNDTTVVPLHLTPLAVHRGNERVWQRTTIDADVIMDLDHLSGSCNDDLDQWRNAARAYTLSRDALSLMFYQAKSLVGVRE